MTDEAVSPETTAAAEADSATPQPPEPQEPRSARDDVADALKSLDIADDDAPEPQEADSADAEDGPPRGPDGKFVKREAADDEGEDAPKAKAEDADAEDTPEPKKAAKDEADAEKAETEPEKPVRDEYSDPPARLHDRAKDAWAEAPKEVRAEVHRAFADMEKGLSEYQQRWEPLKDWDALARQHGTTIQDALQRYTGFERAIRENPLEGLRQACADLGVDFGKVVAEASGEPQDQTLGRYEAQINKLTQHIAHLEQQQKQAIESIQTQQQTATMKEVEAFAAEHPRFDELAPDIAYFLRPGPNGENPRAETLEEAYDLAERLNPAPAPASRPAAQTREQETPKPKPAAQTRKEASLSVAGAPGPGSDPANRKPPASAREAVRNSLASLGL